MTIFIMLISLSVFLLILLLYAWSKYNRYVILRNQVRTDYSDIEVQLQRRLSLIEKLAALAGEYAKHEKSTFTDVAKARSAVTSSKTAADAAKADNLLTDTLRSLFAVVEAHPQLKASENYKLLREDLNLTENAIAGYREEYNLSAQKYNNAIQVFPGLLVAQVFAFHDADLFELKPNPTKT